MSNRNSAQWRESMLRSQVLETPIKATSENERIKPLITYCSGISQSVKREKTQTSPVLFPSVEQHMSQVDQHGLGTQLTVERVIIQQFYGPCGVYAEGA
jgi:hypothetical protein